MTNVSEARETLREVTAKIVRFDSDKPMQLGELSDILRAQNAVLLALANEVSET